MSNTNKMNVMAAPPGPFSDGFGGYTSQFFSSPVETIPFVKPDLPPTPVPVAAKVVYGKTGEGDSTGKDVRGTHDCGFAGCGFAGRTTHGLARHVHAMHGGFAGLGRRMAAK